MLEEKDPALIVRQEDPLNAGPPPEALAADGVTPTPRFFVRSHAAPPPLDSDSLHLEIGGLVERRLQLSLAALRAMPRCTVAATLQCAGWRRQELLGVAPVPDELPWGLEAIGTAVWGGTPLALVLRAAGLLPAARHIALTSLDRCAKEGRTFSFGASIPLEKALGEEVLLAYEMNGAPLPAIHGGPLRLIVPGYIGARSVKWLGAVTAQAAPSDNYFQAKAYKIIAPGAADGPALGEVWVNSAILAPEEGARIPAGPLFVRGVALAGGHRTVASVQISADGGRAWQAAALLGPRQPFVWQRWEAELALPPGRHTLAVRAVDSAGATQPELLQTAWNVRGYMNNAWHRVWVTAE